MAKNKNPIDGPLEELAFLAFFLICVAVVLSMAGGILIGTYVARREHLEPANIDLLKDAAAIIGPGEPISRDLWRLAERIEEGE